jgi:carbon-monoxide dehydrogenase medium subunit
MYNFNYHRASGLRQAQNLLGKLEDAKLLAGGMTLLPTMKMRLASPANLVDLDRVEGLNGIELKGRSVVIGALARHADVANDATVGEAIPALAHLAGMIGDPAVRHRGTLGGSVANNDPNADYPAACLGLGATIITTKRKIPADEFFKGLFETALEPDEIITKVSFPLPKKAAYMKFRNPASRYAIVGAFVAKSANGVRVAITGAGPTAFRVPEMEKALAASFTPDAIKDIKVPADDLNADIHASAEYRAHLCNVMARRAVTACG